MLELNLNLTTCWSRYLHDAHFRDEKQETRRGYLKGSRSHSQRRVRIRPASLLPINGCLKKTLCGKVSMWKEKTKAACSELGGNEKRRRTKGHLCLPGWLWTHSLCNEYATLVFQAHLSLGTGQGSTRVEQRPPWESQASVLAHSLRWNAMLLQTLEDTFQLWNPGSGGGTCWGVVAARGAQADGKQHEEVLWMQMSW